MDLLTRLLIACLSVWFIDQCLAKFGITGQVAKVIQIVVLVLAILLIVAGWALGLVKL